MPDWIIQAALCFGMAAVLTILIACIWQEVDRHVMHQVREAERQFREDLRWAHRVGWHRESRKGDQK